MAYRPRMHPWGGPLRAFCLTRPAGSGPPAGGALGRPGRVNAQMGVQPFGRPVAAPPTGPVIEKQMSPEWSIAK